MVGIGTQSCFPRSSPQLTFMKAFIEKLLNLDENRKYLIITCGEEVHFAYNRVGFIISLNFIRLINLLTKWTSRLTEYFQHRNVGLFLISRLVIQYPTISSRSKIST